MDPKNEKSDTVKFPFSGQIGRTEKQLSGLTDISCDQENPLKRLSQTLHKRNEDQEKAYTNVSDSKKFLEKTDFFVLPDTENTEMVLNKCSRLLFDMAPRAIDRVLLNKYKGSPGYLLLDLHLVHHLRFEIATRESYGLDEIDCLNIKEVLFKKDEYMSVEEIIKDLNLSTKILLIFGQDRWYFILRYKKFRFLEDSETGVEDDLLKIQYYYSWLLCVNKQNLAKTELCFMWNLITKAVVRIGRNEFKTEIENLASSQTCDPFKIPDKHTEDSQQKQSDEPGPSGSKIKQTSHENIEKQVHNPTESALNDTLKHDHSKIHKASMFGHCDEVKELLQNGADANKRNNAGESPLYISAKPGHLDVVKELLKNGADTNKCNYRGETPLYISANNGHPDVVKELLQNGADTNEFNNTGETPLHVSAKHGHLDVVKELLKNGADTNKCNYRGETPLYISAMHGHLDVVKELLKNGADANCCNLAGESPLCIASQHGHHDVVKVLLEYGADRNITYYKGKSPLFASSKYKKDKAVDDNYDTDVHINVSNVEKSVLKQTPRLKGGLTCDQSEIERIQKIFNKIDTLVPVSNRQFVVPAGKMSHIYFVHSSDPIDTLWVETTIKTIQNHGFKCCRGLSKIMNEQSFGKLSTEYCVLCLVLTRCFMEEASRECIELLKSQRSEVLAIQLSENKDTDFEFKNLTKIDALGFWKEHIEWFQELLKYLKNTDLENVNDIANEKFNCNPSTAFRVRSSIADAEPIDILILTDQIEKPIITKILENRVKITNPKLVSKESDVIISKSEHVKQLTREQMITAKEIIKANSDQLFKNHRNLNIITSSNLRSKQGGEEIINEPCIVLYCYCKGLIPEEECDFPITLNWETHQLPVDVREGFFEFGGRYNTGASTKYHEKIKIGCGFGILDTDLEATIGPFLKCYGDVGFLTCAHATCDVHPGNYHYRNPDLNVSAGNYQNEKLNVDSVDCRFHKKQRFYVLQPPPNAFEDHVLNADVCAVGEVYEAVFKPTCQRKDESSIDASIVKITNQKRIPQRGEFAVHLLSNLKSANFKELPIFEGSVIKDPLKIDTDARIVKFGMASHATRGILNSNGTVVRSNIAGLRSTNQTSFVSTFQNQFEVGSISTCPSTFFQGGDSGSGVFQVEKQGDEDTLHLIGLAIGFTSYKTAIVTPIKDIMEALKIDDDAFKLCQRSGTSTGATSTGATSTGTTLCLNVTPTNNTALLQN